MAGGHGWAIGLSLSYDRGSPSGVAEAPLLLTLVGHGIMTGALGTIVNDLIVRGKLLGLWVDQRRWPGGGRQD